MSDILHELYEISLKIDRIDILCDEAMSLEGQGRLAEMTAFRHLEAIKNITKETKDYILEI